MLNTQHPNKPPRVIVIVLNYNCKSISHDCIQSLLKSKGDDCQVIFVDNGSTDGSYEFIREKFPQCEFLQNGENLFFAAGNNRGIIKAADMGAEYVFILNNDTLVEPGCIETLVNFMDANPQAAACQPLLCHLSDPDIIASAGCRLGRIGRAWDHSCGLPTKAVGTEPFPVLGVTGGALFIHTSVMVEAGLFDETFQMYFEDVDLSLRLRNAGHSLYCIPSARVLHMVSATTNKMNADRRIYFCERNAFTVMLKNFPLKHVLFGYAFAIPASTVMVGVHLLKGRFGLARYVLKAMGEGIAGLFQHVWGHKKQADRPALFWEFVDSDVIFPPACHGNPPISRGSEK
ncbi:MAG: glycosyltransferase family 2 protein [Syntrophotalea acetylenica]|nr:glycosyltransferase family 2 protein [Syntrophotalea acetylenica]